MKLCPWVTSREYQIFGVGFTCFTTSEWAGRKGFVADFASHTCPIVGTWHALKSRITFKMTRVNAVSQLPTCKHHEPKRRMEKAPTMSDSTTRTVKGRYREVKSKRRREIDNFECTHNKSSELIRCHEVSKIIMQRDARTRAAVSLEWDKREKDEMGEMVVGSKRESYPPAGRRLPATQKRDWGAQLSQFVDPRQHERRLRLAIFLKYSSSRPRVLPLEFSGWASRQHVDFQGCLFSLLLMRVSQNWIKPPTIDRPVFS